MYYSNSKSIEIVQERDAQLPYNKNGVFQADKRQQQSLDGTNLNQKSNFQKQHVQELLSDISFRQSNNFCKLSSLQDHLQTQIQNDASLISQEKFSSIYDQFQQLQNCISTKKNLVFDEIKNEYKNGELQLKQNENNLRNESYQNIQSPQPTKYQKTGRNDDDRGDPICPKIQATFQIDDCSILRVNQNIINIPSKNRINQVQKIHPDTKQKEDRQYIQNAQNIDNQSNQINKNSKQIERNGKNFILKKQTNIIQKLLNQGNFQGEQIVEKQRLNQSKNIFEIKNNKQLETMVHIKLDILNVSQEVCDNHLQIQEINPNGDKNNEENDSHKSNSNRKVDQTSQNQLSEINAFSFQVQNDFDEGRQNQSTKNQLKKNQQRINNILEKTLFEKSKVQIQIDEDMEQTESSSNFQIDNFQCQYTSVQNPINRQSEASSILSQNHRNIKKQFSLENKTNSPLKENSLIDSKNKIQNNHPTDPQAQRILKNNRDNCLITKNSSYQESNSTRDFSRASEIQQSIVSSTNQLGCSENSITIDNRIKELQFDNLFDCEESNGYNHSFTQQNCQNDNTIKFSNEKLKHQQSQVFPFYQKMKSHQENLILKNDLISPLNALGFEKDLNFRNFNIQSIGDGLLQHQKNTESSEIFNQSIDIDMKPISLEKRSNLIFQESLLSKKEEIIYQNRYYQNNKFDQNSGTLQSAPQKEQKKQIEKCEITITSRDQYKNNKNQQQFQDQFEIKNEKDSSDRFIPLRMCDETGNEIFDISKTNIHEQALINKLIKVQKGLSSQEDSQLTQQLENRQSIQTNFISNRGLQLNEITSNTTQSNSYNFQQSTFGLETSLQGDNNYTQSNRNPQNSDFNNNFFESVLLRTQSQRQQDQINQNLGLLLQQAGVSRSGHEVSLQNPLENYQNIFGVQNSYDQVIKQVQQNVVSTNTLPKIKNQYSYQLEGALLYADSEFEISNSNPDLQREVSNGTSNQLNSHKNHAQEEKDHELNKNISNYNNLIEQNLLLNSVNDHKQQNKGSQYVDLTPSSNLTMTNLTTDGIQSCQGIPFFNKIMNQDLSNKINNNGISNPKISNDVFNNQNQTVQCQKSILGGKILKFKSTKSNVQEQIAVEKVKKIEQQQQITKNVCQKQTYDYDFNLNGLINCDQMFLNYTGQHQEESVVNTVRKIPNNPYRILDAPGLCDDFYLNLVDWSSQNLLAVALESSVYVWNATTSTVSELCDLGQTDQVTSLSWSQKGSHLSVGTKSGQVQIWDINYKKKVRSLEGHFQRVSSLAWNNNNTSVVASGSKDRMILLRDLRAQNNQYMKLMDHKQEVCGLRWSLHDENQLASGGNDNQLFIWSANSDQPLAKFSDHQAAVKAINWSPLHRGLLATGGGTADQCIRFWNTISLSSINCINTGSQVCNLVFSKTNDELVSTHGYSLNQVIVWKYPTMEKIATLTGHTFRVLYLAMNPDGSSIVTGAGDERLRFWNIFPKARSSKIGPLGGLNVVGSVNSSLYPSNLDMR